MYVYMYTGEKIIVHKRSDSLLPFYISRVIDCCESCLQQMSTYCMIFHSVLYHNFYLQEIHFCHKYVNTIYFCISNITRDFLINFITIYNYFINKEYNLLF